ALKKKNDPVTLRVPLNNIAKEIIDKYKDYKGEKLFPFISQPKYNFDIKKVLKQAGIDRVVTILNPLTRL
ncbi:MAG TPA: recombinase, partial [Bacteroidales bacterium]|nr:recombinase [Bacteroidales bacterium]